MDIFHRHREAQEHELAAAMLELALQTPEYRPEALIWKGIDALPNDPKLAFIYLSNAAHALPDRADVHALLGRSMLAQGQPELAARYLSAVWQKLPNDPSLRMMLWQARSQSASPAELRRMILAHLPDITAPNELNFVLKILAAQTDAPGTVGVVRYLPEEKEIQGWAVDLRKVHVPVALELEANANTLSVVANVAHPLLTAAGLPATHGGIRVKVPNPTLAVTVRFATGLPLLGSPISAMPTFIPPAAVADVGKCHPVDVLIPVYDGLEETLECINSAIAARKLNRTPHRLVVLDDATPVPALCKALKVLASKGKITLVHQPVNLGFIRTMNRAMALSPRQDVVWLNADTRVHGNWLDRLRDTAYSADDIASVTPFTNNGELMSFPTSRVSQDMPSPEHHAVLDRLADLTNSAHVELETGCGFCLYIKRRALDDVGYLDEIYLSRGYGEETDWCLRARGQGWRHLGAPNVFVAHKGGVSFGEEKALRVAGNNAILRERFPSAERDYEAYCQRDPIQPARNALQRARLPLLRQFLTKVQGNRTPLITRNINELSGVQLSYTQRQSGAVISLNAELPPLPFRIDYRLPAEAQLLLTDLETIGVADFQLDSQETVAEMVMLLLQELELSRTLAISERIDIDVSRLVAPPHNLLLADALHCPVRLNKWVAIAKAVKTANYPYKILVVDEYATVPSLEATGCVLALPTLPGLTSKQCLQLAGCGGALSLDLSPADTCMAVKLAKAYDLPLFAAADIASESTCTRGLEPLNSPRTWASSQQTL